MGFYKIEWRKSTKKDLRRISLPQVSRIISAVERLANNPYPNGCIRLTGSKDTYRTRIGDYRVIYRVLVNRIIIEIHRIRHRKDVYRS